jgi:cysteine desulfurase
MHPIYLDYNATTPLRSEVLEAMLPYLQTHFGNPSSVHAIGRRAKQGLETAREQVAALIHSRPTEILFTSGGTEGNNLALGGVLRAARARGAHVVTTAIEHSSILEPLQALASEGVAITQLPVTPEGRVEAAALATVIRSDTVLVSIGLANHEIGTIQSITKLSQIAKERGALFHTDAVQAAGKVPIDVDALGVDLLTLSAHKIYGPKGIGALYVRKGTGLTSLLYGGPQEREKRAGTENVAAAVGFGMAAALAEQELETNAAQCLRLINKLRDTVLSRIPGTYVNSPSSTCLPNTINIGFADTTGEGLMMSLDLAGIAVSTGSACAAGSLEPSHVLLALGRNTDEAKSALRFSIGRNTTEAEIDRILEILPKVVGRVRAAHSGLSNED